MIICFTEETISDLYDIILENFVKLANNSNGLCIIKKLITFAKKESTINKIIDIQSQNFSLLIQNSYGNYTIQTVFESWGQEYTEPLYKQLYSQFYTLSMSKYSSNVVEKCLERGGDEVLIKFIEEICHKSKLLGKYYLTLSDLMKNSFGNYVVQKALKLSSGHLKAKLTNNIKKNMEKLTDPKLVNKWQSIVNNYAKANLTLYNKVGNFSDSYSSNTLNNSVGSMGSSNSFHSIGQPTMPNSARFSNYNNNNNNNNMFLQQPNMHRVYPRSGGTSPTNNNYKFPNSNNNMNSLNLSVNINYLNFK
jgi:hypothetical protein